jgi:hypothetical protein
MSDQLWGGHQVCGAVSLRHGLLSKSCMAPPATRRRSSAQHARAPSVQPPTSRLACFPHWVCTFVFSMCMLVQQAVQDARSAQAALATARDELIREKGSWRPRAQMLRSTDRLGRRGGGHPAAHRAAARGRGAARAGRDAPRAGAGPAARGLANGAAPAQPRDPLVLSWERCRLTKPRWRRWSSRATH